ncbi:MAG: hypothetical protein K0U41_02025 [Gammaproteobacteria bacterium]|nr:hypothetical protein [Gammaproteobacteria bacterium]
MTELKETPVENDPVNDIASDSASDTADNNHSLNKPNTVKGFTGEYLTHTNIDGVSYPTYRLATKGTGGAKLSEGDKVTFTASGRKHTGKVKATTGDNKLDVVFCDVQIT